MKSIDYVSDDDTGLPTAAIEPVPEGCVSTVEDRKLEDRERWWNMGLKAISDGKLAVLLLSGGQVYLYFYFFILSLLSSVRLIYTHIELFLFIKQIPY